MSTDPLEDALNRLAAGEARPEYIDILRQAISLHKIDLASNVVTADRGGVAIDGNVSNSTITTHNWILPEKVLKMLRSHPSPPPLPVEGVLPERSTLQPGSRLNIPFNALFTGREEYLLDMAKLLLYPNSGDQGIIPGAIFAGMGGIGKSQLAVEFCYRYGRFFQGVHWVQADLDMAGEIADCGRAMDLPFWPDKLPEQVEATLNAWKEGGRHLIVLDNSESLQVIQDWLPRLLPARVLITSRREHWPPDLGLAVVHLNVLTRSQSRELLCKLAPRLKGTAATELDEVASYLGDLPLALDLAGRYMAMVPDLSIQCYVAELKDARYALEHPSQKDGAEYSPTRHSTSLAATFALSWDQLTEADDPARLVFRMCGYCAPNTPIPKQLLLGALGAEKTDHRLDKALWKLDSLGLTEPAEGGRRLHSLLAEFARLKDSDEKESVLNNLAQAMSNLAVQANMSGLPENFKPLQEHVKSIALAAEIIELNDTRLLWSELGYYLKEVAEYNEAIKHFERALKINEKFYGRNGRREEGRLLGSLGLCWWALGKLGNAVNCYKRALAIAREVGDRRAEGRHLGSLGLAWASFIDKSIAVGYFKEALAIAREVGDRQAEESHLGSLGLIWAEEGRANTVSAPVVSEAVTYYFHRAIQCYERALTIAREIKDHRGEGSHLGNLGNAWLYLGNIPTAIDYFEQALVKLHERGDRRNEGFHLANLGNAYQSLGQVQEAQQYWQEAIAIFDVIGDPRASAVKAYLEKSRANLEPKMEE